MASSPWTSSSRCSCRLPVLCIRLISLIRHIRHIRSIRSIQVLSSFSLGESDAQLKQLSARLLRGQQSLQTSELLETFHLEYRESSEGEAAPRSPPQWAQPLLDTVSRQCAMRQRGSLELFQTFDSDGDGFISPDEFQEAMLRLGGYDTAGHTAEQLGRVKEMLRDLAEWVDRDGNGEINYMEFMAAFQLVDRGGQAAGAATAEDAEGGMQQGGARTEPADSPVALIDQLVENLCTFFYRHRWTLKHAFEFFDTDGDGVVSPDEFSTALQALSRMALEDGSQGLQFSTAAVEHLVSSIDTDGDGFIDYDEFLHALQTRDAMEM